MNTKQEIKKLKDFKKALYVIDMVEGFVNIGPMANKKYNDLVPQQLKVIEDFRKQKESVNFVMEGHNEEAIEFLNYPKHCVKGTEEANLIKEFRNELFLPNTNQYYKNCINGMLVNNIMNDIEKMTNLKEAIFMGVCEDLCVMDFVRTYARYMDELNRKIDIYVIANTVDTFDAPNHNREEWKKIARMVMEQAGVIYVNDYEEIKERRMNYGK